MRGPDTFHGRRLDEFDTRINFSKYATTNGDRSDVNVINLNTARVRKLDEAHRSDVAKNAAAAFEKDPDAGLRIITSDASHATGSDCS